jgi:hypothetical protein
MTTKASVGVSTKKDSFTAGEEAAKKALKKLGSSADVLLVLASSKFEHQKLLDGITSITKKTPMVGGTTAGEIATDKVRDNSVVIMALSSDEMKFATAIAKNLGKDEIKAGKQLTASLLKKIPRKIAKTMIIVPDGLAGDGAKLVKGCQSVAGKNFEIVGGALADGADFKKTFQYYNGKVYTNSCPGLMFGGSFVSSTGIRSGWESIGNRIKVTKSTGNVLEELDGIPALDYYEKCLGEKRAKKLPGIGLEYPIGMIDEVAMIKGKEMYFQLRSPLAIDKEKRTITFAASIPEGKEITLTSASRESVIEGSKVAANQAKEILEGVKPSFLIVFDCIGRKLVLNKRVQEEIDAIQKVLGKDVPMIGFFTYGEIGPIDKREEKLKSTRWHNQTTIILAIGKDE